ncbi:MAG: hypothetical protein Q8M31_01175 [Beijerinckiaceae bacterium]|nr:hypothetical protein [Beijerinckiaceae bacterium]
MKFFPIIAASIVVGALAIGPAFAQSSGGSAQKVGAGKKQSGQPTCRALSRQQIPGGNMRHDARYRHEDFTSPPRLVPIAPKLSAV